MTLTTAMQLKDIVLSHPAAARVLESFHLDYCCGGQDTLADACHAARLDSEAVLHALERARAEPTPPKAIDQAPLATLIPFIIDTHHAFTRRELERLAVLLDKVVAHHGGKHPELLTIGTRFQMLRSDLEPHLTKEERVLFPYIVALEAWQTGAGDHPTACFGTIDHPLRQMQNEHRTVGTLLKELRRLTADYAPPDDGCASYRALYEGLEALEKDLFQHIHLENNVLFPRAVQLAEATENARPISAAPGTPLAGPSDSP